MELSDRGNLREQILHQMDGRTSYVSDEDIYREIDRAILHSGHIGYGTLSEKEELRRQMFLLYLFRCKSNTREVIHHAR